MHGARDDRRLHSDRLGSQVLCQSLRGCRGRCLERGLHPVKETCLSTRKRLWEFVKTHSRGWSGERRKNALYSREFGAISPCGFPVFRETEGSGAEGRRKSKE